MMMRVWNGWIDCADSFKQWLRLMPWKRESSYNDEGWFRVLRIEPFFDVLGSWLEDRDDYPTPWGNDQ